MGSKRGIARDAEADNLPIVVAHRIDHAVIDVALYGLDVFRPALGADHCPNMVNRPEIRGIGQPRILPVEIEWLRRAAASSSTVPNRETGSRRCSSVRCAARSRSRHRRYRRPPQCRIENTSHTKPAGIAPTGQTTAYCRCHLRHIRRWTAATLFALRCRGSRQALGIDERWPEVG